MANYNITNEDYTEEVRMLEDTDPARAETVFNPLFLRILNNIAYLKKKYEENIEGLMQKIADLSADVSNIAFQLAIKDLIDTDGMKHVVVDKIESLDDINLISGKFDESQKKVYI